jgi:hypothetical protein
MLLFGWTLYSLWNHNKQSNPNHVWMCKTKNWNEICSPVLFTTTVQTSTRPWHFFGSSSYCTHGERGGPPSSAAKGIHRSLTAEPSGSVVQGAEGRCGETGWMREGRAARFLGPPAKGEGGRRSSPAHRRREGSAARFDGEGREGRRRRREEGSVTCR